MLTDQLDPSDKTKNPSLTICLHNFLEQFFVCGLGYLSSPHLLMIPSLSLEKFDNDIGPGEQDQQHQVIQQQQVPQLQPHLAPNQQPVPHLQPQLAPNKLRTWEECQRAGIRYQP